MRLRRSRVHDSRTYTIHATYATDANTAGSTVVIPYTVNKVQPGIALISSVPGTAAYGQAITFTVTVSPAAAPRSSRRTAAR